MKSSTTPDFWESYRALPQKVRDLARKTYQLWQANSGHGSLHWKPLAPGLVGPCWFAISRTRASPRRHRLLVLDWHAQRFRQDHQTIYLRRIKRQMVRAALAHSIADANDEARFAELYKQGELTSARQAKLAAIQSSKRALNILGTFAFCC